MHRFTFSVLRFIEEHSLIDKDSRILAGISGGADSVCLFYVLLELREKLSFELSAVHVEHGIRGESSRRDEAFVRNLCGFEGIPLKVYNENVPDYASKHSMTMEEAARKLRYEAFFKALEEMKADKIAVAHHMNDQAETFLFNLIRGSSLSGLSGMSPEKEKVIRPLLSRTRSEIEAYISEKGLRHITDESNSDEAFSRNRIRLNVIPELEKIGNGAVPHIFRTCETINEAEAYIQSEADKLYEAVVTKKTCKSPDDPVFSLDLSSGTFSHSAHIIRSNVIKRILSELSGRWKDISSINIEDILKLAENKSGKSINLPYGLLALKTEQSLILGTAGAVEDISAPVKEPPLIEEIPLAPGRVTARAFNISIECELTDYEPSMGFPENAYTKWIDYDKIKTGLCLRSRKSGDKIAIDGDLHTQSLKKYLINEKVPANERDSLPLIADGNNIVWIIGRRLSAVYKLGPDTRRVLKIKINGG
ncbi:MAG: tRNA lysidine(34) synthetase TilS [Lachnospiraceae bacterium]|nr:tRNA lysidine(34) synthetase TilS [Lachnospiraceae bacterium]